MHDANAAANRASRRPLTKDTEQEAIIINCSGRSIYPEEKSVQTSGATSAINYAELAGKELNASTCLLISALIRRNLFRAAPQNYSSQKVQTP
jgi:hypothetical protein